jgi:uncharacterized membrane protein
MENKQNEDARRKTIFCVLTVARQIHGEYILIKTERAFTTQEKANELLYVLKAQYTKDGKAVPITVTTEHGEIACHCEIGVFEVDLEETQGE